MTEPLTPAGAPAREPDAVGLGVLRAAITALVVLHHAALAYHPYAPPPFASLLAAPYWQAFPVVDADRWSGALWIVAVNDTFFMSLMFLLSGVFVWPSLARRGPGRYLAARARRLGVPFVVAVALLAPLAYLPSYLQTGSTDGFWHTWLALETWPSGPAWFLWVLLAFDALAVALAPPLVRLARRLAPRRPAAVFAVLVAASALAYLPMAQHFGTLRWFGVGPFAVQSARVIHYAVYFFAGLALGACGSRVLSPDGLLARRWPAWLAAAAVAFAAAIYATSRDLATQGAPAWQLADQLGFVVACAALSFAFLAIFLRLPWRRHAFASLRRHAYAIYLVHYVFVSWILYALLDAALPGALKLALAFPAALAASWLTAAALARLRRYSEDHLRWSSLPPRSQGAPPLPTGRARGVPSPDPRKQVAR
jgi:peptidoglycan/LPS O-acetylase OafA/YrhL